MMRSFVKKIISITCALAIAGGLCRLPAAYADGSVSGNKVIFNDSTGANLIGYPSTSNVIKQTEEADGNQCTLVQKPQGAEPSSSFHLNAKNIVSESDYVIYEFRLKNLNATSFFKAYIGYLENNLDVAALANGVLYFDQSTQVAIPLGEWHKISFAVDYYAKKVTYYFDGVQQGEGRSIADCSFADKTLVDCFRFHVTPFGSSAIPSSIYAPASGDSIEFLLDDVCVYEAKEPKGKVIFNDSTGANLIGYPSTSNVIKQTEEADGNQCTLVQKPQGAEPSSSFHLNAKNIVSESDYVIYEFRLKNLNATSFFKAYIGYLENNLDVAALANGVLYFDQSTQVAIPLGEWHKISFAVDYYAKKVTYYFDGVQQGEGRSIADCSFADKTLVDCFRFHVTPFGSSAIPSSIYAPASGDSIEFLLDDVCVYEEKEPIDNVESVDKMIEISDRTVFESDNAYRDMLSGYWGLHLGSGVLFLNGEKIILEHAPYAKGDTYMVPFYELSAALGLEGSISDNLAVLGSNRTEIVESEITDTETFIPFNTYFVTLLGKQVYQYETVFNKGMSIMGDTLFTPPVGTDMDKLNSYLLFARPSTETIHAAYSQSAVYGAHPRVQATAEDFVRLRSECETNANKRSWKNWIIRRANEYVANPTPVEYVVKDGRLLEVSREVDSRMYALGMAYQLTGETKYADRAWLDLKAVSEFANWHPGHALDVGEMASGVAIGYDWMYDAFTPEQRAIIEKGVYNNCFYDYNILYSTGRGAMSQLAIGDSNWNNICSGGVSLMSIAMLDVYPEVAETILSRAIRCIEPAIVRFAPEGAWYEGPDYWSLTWQYTAKILSGLQTVFGTSYGLDRLEGLCTSARWAIALQSPYGIYPYGDSKDYGKSSINLYTPEMLYMGAHYNDPFVTRTVLEHLNPHWQNGEQLAMSLLWYDTSTPETVEEMPLDMYDAYDGVITMRDSWDQSSQNFVGIHAGKTNTDHGHLDGASFVFDSMGIRWAKDLGMGDYNQTGYWDEKDGGDRWKIFKMRAEAHNCIVINPDENQDQIWESTAPITKYESDAYGGIALVDTTELYAKNVNQSRRGFFFTDNRQSLVVRDEINLKKESDIYWFMLTYSDITMTKVDERTVLLTAQNGKQLKLTFETDADSAEISYGAAEPLPESYHNEEDKAADANRLAIKLHDGGVDTVNLTVKLTPVGINASSVSAYDKPMDTWSLPNLTAEKANGGCDIYGFTYCPEGHTAFLAVETMKNGLMQDVSLQRFNSGYIAVDTTVACKEDESVSAYLLTDYLAPLCKKAKYESLKESAQ